MKMRKCIQEGGKTNESSVRKFNQKIQNLYKKKTNFTPWIFLIIKNSSHKRCTNRFDSSYMKIYIFYC